jgi:hypothetical protein
MTDSSTDTKKQNEEFKRKIKRDWDNYITTFDEKLDNIWNFVMYNDFMSEEMKKFSREIRFLKEDIESKDSKIGRLEEDVDDLIYRNRKLSNKLEKTKPSKTNKKRKREDDKWFNKEKRKKPKTFVAINKDDINKLLLRVFQNLKSIDDIINLKEDPNRFNYFSNLKYKKLYNLIPSLENLQKVIGMKRVKDDVFKMICYFIHGLNGNGELNHCVITGPPGVGKTTLASILGDIYLGLGFLKNNNFIVAKRSDLIGKYCGHTAVQTQEVIDKAEGGVLFIDEVYSLGNPGKRDVFTKECIDTINQNLTEKGDKFLCIIAGYEEDVEKCFFAYNKGLERRFPLRFKIDKYDSNELLLILKKFINEEFWKIEDDKYILKLLKDNKELFQYYGGDMKIIFQNAKKIFSLRLMNEKIDLVINDKLLKNTDFKGALKEFKLNRKTKEMPEFVKNMFM